MASLLADPTTLVVGAASVLGGLFFLQQQLGKSGPGGDASDENLDDLADFIEGSKKSKKAAAKKQKKAKKKAAAKPAQAPAPQDDDDDESDDVDDEPEPVKEVVKEPEPTPAPVMSKKAKKKAKAKAAAAAEKEQEKITKDDLRSLLSKEKPAEPATDATAGGKKKKKKKKAASATPAGESKVAAPAPAPKATKAVADEVVAEENNDDEWVTIESSSSKRRRRQAEELKAIAAANAASSWDGAEENDGEESVPQGPPQVTVSIKLGSAAGFVIGKKGARVLSIQEESGANINIKRDSGAAVITGTQEEVDHASSIIQGFLEDHAFEASKIEVFIPIGDDPSAVRKLIGRGGGNIKYIQEQTDIKIDVMESEGKVRLFGLPDAMDYAKDLAMQALDGLNIQSGPQSVRSITLDEQGIITFIGRGGETIRRFNEDFPSCRFDIDKAKNSIRVSAPTDSDVDAAIDAINKLLQDSNFTDMIDISDCTGAVIGKGGATIKRIQQESGARLDVEKEDYGTFLKVTGMPESVQRAREEVERVRSEPPPKKPLKEGEVDFEIELGGASSAVIGRKGQKIKSIQESSGAKLDIPRGSSYCRIMGTPEAVESAKVLVLEVKAEWDEKNKPAGKDDDSAFAVTEDPVATPGEAGDNGWQQPPPEDAGSGGWGAEPPKPTDDADQGWGAEPGAAGNDWGGGSGW